MAITRKSRKTIKEEYVMQVDLESHTRDMAEQEAKNLVVIPHETLNNLITLLEGRMLKENETIAGTIEEVREYM